MYKYILYNILCYTCRFTYTCTLFTKCTKVYENRLFYMLVVNFISTATNLNKEIQSNLFHICHVDLIKSFFDLNPRDNQVILFREFVKPKFEILLDLICLARIK